MFNSLAPLGIFCFKKTHTRGNFRGLSTNLSYQTFTRCARIAQSVARCLHYLDTSAAHIRIPLATLAKYADYWENCSIVSAVVCIHGSGSITSAGEERANLSAFVYL